MSDIVHISANVVFREKVNQPIHHLKLLIMTFGTFLLYALGATVLLPIIPNLAMLIIAMIINPFVTTNWNAINLFGH